MKKKIYSFAISIVLFFAVLTPATADLFENYTEGGRVLGMGGAFAGLADDVYSLIYNPAGLANVKGIVINANYQPEFASDDISKMNFLASMNLGLLTVGINFYQLGQDGGLVMQKIGLAAGMEFKGVKLGPIYNIKIGLGANLYMMSLDGYFPYAGENINDNPTAISGGVGFLFNLLTDKLTLGGYWDNINSPNISFYDDGSGSDIKANFRIGASYLVNKYFRLSADYLLKDSDLGGLSADNIFAGAEIYFYDAVMLRFGFDEGKMTIGMGIKSDMLDFNVATRVEEDLAMYYQFDVTVKIK